MSCAKAFRSVVSNLRVEEMSEESNATLKEQLAIEDAKLEEARKALTAPRKERKRESKVNIKAIKEQVKQQQKLKEEIRCHSNIRDESIESYISVYETMQTILRADDLLPSM